jgi:ABC-type polysaccharide/polyol phosphate transport system ATPase subunit
MEDFGPSNGQAPPAVLAEDVQKQYNLGELSSLKLTLRRVARLLRVSDRAAFAALDGVSFEINSGDGFALVGRNGSGKSTLLHMICGITLPTRGQIVVRGRLLPLLAVGASFHPELTGRENVVLFATVLGLTRETAIARMDDIAAFAELEHHMDTPIKRYSDGMQSRLSFAIAMLFPADIYVFDEVLAVVDGEFRERCLCEIENLRQRGKTVIFVSHDLNQVERLCNRALWLDRGRRKAFGDAEDVLPAYARELTHT